MTEKPRETQAESHVVELKEKVNNSSLMKHQKSGSHDGMMTAFKVDLSEGWFAIASKIDSQGLRYP